MRELMETLQKINENDAAKTSDKFYEILYLLDGPDSMINQLAELFEKFGVERENEGYEEAMNVSREETQYDNY